MKYIYPAIFQIDADGINVSFPDFESCYTYGDTMEDAMYMAEDVLCLTLYDLEESGLSAPKSSYIKDIPSDDTSFVSYVHCDTMAYRKLYENKAVKKTLTIPAWLNTMAERESINFSALLQNALKTELHID